MTINTPLLKEWDLVKKLYDAIVDTWDSTNHTLRTDAEIDVHGADIASQTTLAAVLAKIVAAPALEAGNLATIAARLLSSGTVAAADLLASILARIPTLGPQTAAGSVSVTPASNSGNFPTAEKGPEIYPTRSAAVVIAIANANSTQSAALPTGLYEVTANLDVSIALPGANPTATAADTPVWAFRYNYVQITAANDKIAAIRQLTTTGSVWLTRIGA